MLLKENLHAEEADVDKILTLQGLLMFQAFGMLVEFED